jgi:hypothetical protein
MNTKKSKAKPRKRRPKAPTALDVLVKDLRVDKYELNVRLDKLEAILTGRLREFEVLVMEVLKELRTPGRAASDGLAEERRRASEA